MRVSFTSPGIVLGSKKVGLGIIRSLGLKNIPVDTIYYNKNDYGHVSKHSNRSFFAPHPSENEQKFIEFLLAYNKNSRRGVLFPSDDDSLAAVAKYKKELSERFIVPVNNWNNIKKLIDHETVFETAHKYGVPAPRSFKPLDYEQAESFAKEVGFPVILRPAKGNVLKDIFKTDSILIENSSRLKNFFLIAQKFNKYVILEEYIPGETDQVNYCSYYVKGKPILEFSSLNLRVSPTSSGIPRVLSSRYIPELFSPARAILSAFKYRGFSCIEFKKDSRSGVYKILKITPRFNANIPLATECGINFPYHIYVHSLKGIIPEEQTFYKEGIYWIDPGQDLADVLRHREFLSKDNWIKPYFMKKVFSIPSIKDPMPGIKRFYDVFKTLPAIAAGKIIKKRMQQV
jgi:D-aspartate ligase